MPIEKETIRGNIFAIERILTRLLIEAVKDTEKPKDAISRFLVELDPQVREDEVLNAAEQNAALGTLVRVAEYANQHFARRPG